MSTAFLLLGGLYLAVVINNKCSDSKEVWAGTWDEPAYKHFYINPKTEEVEVIYFGEDGNFLRTRQVTDDGYPKSHLNRFSPARRVQANFEMFGYFKDLHKRNEYYDLDDEAVRKEYYENYVTLMIMKDEYSEPLEVYQGDYHTSSWEWSATDNKHVKVFYNCGSSCMYVYEINIDTGKIESEGHVY